MPETILVYPIPLSSLFKEPVGDIRVRSLAFALGGDLEESGQQFLVTLLGMILATGEKEGLTKV